MKVKNSGIQNICVSIKSGSFTITKDEVVEMEDHEFDVLHRIFPKLIKIEEKKLVSEPAPIKEEVKDVKSKKSRK